MNEVHEFFVQRPEISEVAHVTTYRLWGPGGQIKVKINDFGEAKAGARYTAFARYVDFQGRPDPVVNTYGASIGDPAATVEGALASVNWNVFQEDDQS